MSAPEIIVYSSDGCAYCEKVKEYLKDLGFEYEERNGSLHKEYFDQLKEKKIFGTPATFVNGNLVLGFQEKKFKKLLRISEDESAKTVPSPKGR
jgi:thioredoxin reductase (NADPH)